MNTIKRWVLRRRFLKKTKGLRTKQLQEVSRYMKKVYNPVYYGVKPRHHVDLSSNETVSFVKAMHEVYNPEIKKDYIEMVDVEDMKAHA